jgi:hypothetical protein
MSIPAEQDDTDKHLTHVLPWANDPQREEETNRLQRAVMEAAQRLGHDSEPSPQTPAQPQRRRAVSLRLAEGPSSPNNSPQQDNNPQNDAEEINQRIWAGLMPKFVAPPPREPIGLPGLGMATGLVSAVAVAAAVALVVVNVVQVPMISAGDSNENEIRNIPSASTAALGSQTNVAAAEAKSPSADAPTMPAGTLLAAVPTDEIAAPKSPAPTPPLPAAQPSPPQPSLEVEPARPDTAAPKAVAAPETRPTISLTRDEIAALLKRGQGLIAAGDIASARLILTHVADAGDAEASFILAGTYDPAVLATRRVVGVQPDPAKARAWYAKAAELGSSEAKRHLDQSALR